MKIDKAYLRLKFKEYNKLYFGRKLITPQFTTFLSGRGYLGICYYHKDKSRMKISIARNVDWTEETLRKVLVHEMIHLYLFQNVGYRQGNSHGKHFREMAEKIKETDGLVITKFNPEIILINKKKTEQPKTFLGKIFAPLKRFLIGT